MKRERRRLLFFNSESKINSLPWSINISEFFEKCSRCHACLSVCETKIIQLNKAGFPVIDFSKGQGECSFCYACADVCEQPIFVHKSERPWQNVVKIHSTCLSLHHIECRTCSECCNEQAIKFAPKVGGYQLELTPEKCTGCGACINPCPVNAIELISACSRVATEEPNNGI